MESTYFTSPLGQEYSQQKLQTLSYQNFLLKRILDQWSAARSISPEHQTGVPSTPTRRPPGVCVTTQKSPRMTTMCMVCPSTCLATYPTRNGQLLTHL